MSQFAVIAARARLARIKLAEAALLPDQVKAQFNFAAPAKPRPRPAPQTTRAAIGQGVTSSIGGWLGNLARRFHAVFGPQEAPS